MTEDQKKHLGRLNYKFVDYNTVKYTNGVLEHKTLLADLDTLTLLYHLRDEVVDAFNFVQTAIDGIEAKQSLNGQGLGFL